MGDFRTQSTTLTVMTTRNYTARIGHQISVFIENRPGTLGAVIDVLRENKVNMLALSLSEGLEIGYLRIAVDKLDVARECLKKSGHLVLEREVLLFEVPNTPGGLAAVVDQLARNGVNIEYAYSANSPSSDRSMIVVRVTDPRGALALLG
jgi:hypothetical protein